MAEPPEKTAVVVSVDDSLSDMNQMAEKCRAAGLEVHDRLDFLGQITGEIDPDKEDALRSIPGVVSVDASQTYQLPPPDSDIQ